MPEIPDQEEEAMEMSDEQLKQLMEELQQLMEDTLIPSELTGGAATA